MNLKLAITRWTGQKYKGENMTQIIYAPIRQPYTSQKQNSKCPFCNYKEENSLLVYEGNTAVIIANKFPYLFGHLMVFPKRHITEVNEQNKDEDKDIMLLIKRSVKYLEDAFHPDGFDIGVNLKSAGGSSVKHLHYHIVPRYTGDTGFMNVLENAAIMSEKPETMVQKLKRKNNLF